MKRAAEPSAEEAAFPDELDLHFSSARAAPLRREPAPASRILCRARSPRAEPGDREPAARQGALLQQSARPRQRSAAGPLVRLAGGLHRQAQQPLRCRDRRRSRPPRSSARTRATRSVPSAASSALNRPVDRASAERMCQPGRFLEAILAPGFDDDALDWLKTKPTWRNSVRLLDLGGARSRPAARRPRDSTFGASRGACSSRAGTRRARPGRRPSRDHPRAD